MGSGSFFKQQRTLFKIRRSALKISRPDCMTVCKGNPDSPENIQAADHRKDIQPSFQRKK